MTTRLRDLFPEFASIRGLEEAYGREFPFANEALAVARLRGSLGLTQAQLAERAGTTQSVIARLESGRHPVEVRLLHRIADAVGQPLMVAFGGHDNPEVGEQVSGEHDQAVDHEQAHQQGLMDPHSEDDVLEGFNAANTAGDFRTASQIAEQLATEPTSARRRLAVAIARFNQERYGAAAEWAETALAEGLAGDAREVALHVLGRARLQRGERRRALETLRQIGEPRQTGWLAVGALAEAELAMGHTRLAWRAATDALARAPDQPEAHYVVARVAWHVGNVWDALEHVAVFRAAAPDDPDGLLLHGSVLGFIGDSNGDSSAYERALGFFKRAVRDRPPQALRLCGVTAARLGRWRDALQYAERLCRIASPYKRREPTAREVELIVSEALARLLDEDGNDSHSEFASAIKEAEARFGAISAVRRYAAIRSASIGDVRGLLGYLDLREENVHGAEPPVRFIVGVAYAAAGDHDRALALFRTLADFEGPEEVALLFTRTALESGETEEAAHFVRRIAEGSGPRADMAAIALRVFEAQGQLDHRRWAGRWRLAASQPKTWAITSDPRSSPWEGRHRDASPVLDRLTTILPSRFVH